VHDLTSSRPPALTLAAVLVAVQGVGLVALGVVGLLDLVSSRVEVGLSVAVFFAAYGGGLLTCAWALWRVRAWPRGPVLLTQLIQVGISWNVRENLLVAVPLALVALVTIAAMLHPATLRVLLGETDEPAR
jgi:hypothetical protein